MSTDEKSSPEAAYQELLQANTILKGQVIAGKRIENKFQSLWESAPDANLIVNAAGEIILVNHETEKMFGYGRTELLGQMIEILIPDRFHGHHNQYRTHYFLEPKRRPMGMGMNLYAKRKGGMEFPVEISLSPLQNENEIEILVTVRDVTERKRALELIAQQSHSLLELSTPVIKLMNGLVLLPLIGVVDTLRAQQIMENLLQAIVAHEARVALLDITGVPVIDTQVAQHLIKTVAAAKMLGAEVVLTGISPESAQTIVTLGIDLRQIRTKGSLEVGLLEAFHLLGKTLNSGHL